MIVDGDINFDLITFGPAKELLIRILKKNPDERASLEDIFADEWLTNNGQESVNMKTIVYN